MHRRKLKLSADEDFVLTAWQYRMMQRDIAAPSGKHLPHKREARNSFRHAAVEAIAQRDNNDWWPAIADAVDRIVPTGETADMEALENAGPKFSSVVSKRSRALLLLIELYGFEPWSEGKWDKGTRGDILTEVHQAMGQLHHQDLNAVETAYADALKTLSRSSSWIKYALLAGAGLGLGVLSGGLAAPAIAGAYGTLVLGYSGAVATTAGMAALGGGSIAAGGLGMAGGAALITGLSGAVGAGAATLHRAVIQRTQSSAHRNLQRNLWEDGQRITEQVTTTRSGMPFAQVTDPYMALILLLKHWASDFVTPMSLPLPGWTLLCEMPNRDIRKFAYAAYAGGNSGDGLNLRSGVLTPTLGAFTTEVIIRTHAHLSAYRDVGSPRLSTSGVAKRTEMLLAAHAAAGAVSLSKTAATKGAAAVRHLNMPVLLRLGRLALQVRSDAATRAAAGAPSWDQLLQNEAATWTLPEAIRIAELLSGPGSVVSSADGIE